MRIGDENTRLQLRTVDLLLELLNIKLNNMEIINKLDKLYDKLEVEENDYVNDVFSNASAEMQKMDKNGTYQAVFEEKR